MAKSITGIVSSNSGNKTIVVTVSTRKTHPIYKKQYSVSSKFMAHDEMNEAGIGDSVTISETRPISARKHFKLIAVVNKAIIRHVEPEETKPAIEKVKEPIVKPSKKIANTDNSSDQEDEK